MIRKIYHKINHLFLKLYLFFKKYSLLGKYLPRYTNIELSFKQKIEILLNLINIKTSINFGPITKFDIRSSKIIIERNDTKSLLYIFDRPILKNYSKIREEWSEFHFAPKYNQIDDISFYQDQAIGKKNLLSIDHGKVNEILTNYLDLQVSLGKKYGEEVTIKEFIKEPFNFFLEKNYLGYFPEVISKKITDLTFSNKKINLVPSSIEPWPNVINNKLEFSDLSPVEFSKAPVLYDFCYILMKYELYGKRKLNHETLLEKIFNEFTKINNSKRSGNSSSNTLFKKIISIIDLEDFLNNYILMIFFHCFMKYKSTGYFLKDSPRERLLNSINNHLVIFRQIKV